MGTGQELVRIDDRTFSCYHNDKKVMVTIDQELHTYVWYGTLKSFVDPEGSKAGALSLLYSGSRSKLPVRINGVTVDYWFILIDKVRSMAILADIPELNDLLVIMESRLKFPDDKNLAPLTGSTDLDQVEILNKQLSIIIQNAKQNEIKWTKQGEINTKLETTTHDHDKDIKLLYNKHVEHEERFIAMEESAYVKRNGLQMITVLAWLENNDIVIPKSIKINERIYIFTWFWNIANSRYGFASEKVPHPEESRWRAYDYPRDIADKVGNDFIIEHQDHPGDPSMKQPDLRCLFKRRRTLRKLLWEQWTKHPDWFKFVDQMRKDQEYRCGMCGKHEKDYGVGRLVGHHLGKEGYDHLRREVHRKHAIAVCPKCHNRHHEEP